MFKKKISKLFFFSLLLVFLLGANFVLALEVTYPDLPGVDPPQDFLQKIDQGLIPGEQTLSLYVQYFYNLALWIAGVIALGSLIYGGIRYLTSSGKPEVMASAKNQLLGVFFGLLLLFGSYIVFTIINPELIIFQIPEPEPIQNGQQVPKISSPPAIEEIRTSINTELPFGTIIEKGVFAGAIISCDECGKGAINICDETECLKIGPWCEFRNGKWGDCIEKETPRTPRIYNNSVITKTLADNLKQQSEDLTNYAHRCTCRSTDPENPCGSNVSGDTTWKCDCGGCGATEPCTCDPCEKVRGDIQDAEQKNLENIYLGTEITYPDYYSGDDIKITTSLTEEQVKTEKEVRLLKEQLDKLERAEEFILECYDWLDSLADFLAKKDSFQAGGNILREVNFWDEILIRGDWATFYCPVSGTILGKTEYIDTTGDISQQMEDMPTVEEIASEESPACSTEIPIGEIIDRTKRVGYKLVERMETLIEKDKELIDAVDTLEILVSQCSSKRGCERRCTCFGCLCSHHHHCIPGCKGWVYCCADSSGPYPSECKDRDEDTPCPYEEIDDQLEEIQRIHQEITDLIEEKSDGSTPKEKIDTIGILPIIKEVTPGILEDLEEKIRKEMRYCVTDVPLEETEVPELINSMLTCKSSERSPGPEGPGGTIIQKCCLEEAPFQDCLENCYLSGDYKKYKECLYDCVDALPDDINKCRHKLNFYCCQF